MLTGNDSLLCHWHGHGHLRALPTVLETVLAVLRALPTVLETVLAAERRPLAAEKRPLAAERRPLAAERWPLAAERRPRLADSMWSMPQPWRPGSRSPSAGTALKGIVSGCVLGRWDGRDSGSVQWSQWSQWSARRAARRPALVGSLLLPAPAQ